MKVARYTAQHVLRLSDVDFDLGGRHLFLVGGKNDQGKTSALTALLMALCGRSGFDSYPEIQLKEGEDEGSVRVELCGDDSEPPKLTVDLKIKRKRGGQVIEEFKLLDEHDREVKEPRKLLQRLYELRAFDPLAFERLDRKGKKALLSKLLALDFSKLDEQHAALYKEREDVNRDAKKAKAQVEAMPEFKDAPAAEVSTADLLAQLKVRQEQNAANREERTRLDDLRSLIKSCESVVEECTADLDNAVRKVRACEEQLARAKERLAEKQNLGQQQAYLVTDLLDADEEEVRARIANSGEENRKLGANQAKSKAKERLRDLEGKSEELTRSLHGIEKQKEEAISKAEWPVPGLSFDSDGVLFDGLPFEQASKSKRVLASVRIGMALNPRLRLLVCQDGSDLDSDTMAALDGLLKEKDFQMVLELVTRSEADEELCAVIVQDGRVRQAKT